MPSVVRAIENNMILIRFEDKGNWSKDVSLTLHHYRNEIFRRIIQEGSRFENNVKWYLAVRVEMKKSTLMHDGNQKETSTNITLHGRIRKLININKNDLNEQFNLSLNKIIKTLEDFVQNGSGWVLGRVLYVDLNIVRYRPFQGASSSFIELPSKLAKRKAVINIKNPNDQKCFIWSVLEFIHPQPDKHKKVKWYKKFEDDLNMTGIEYPVRVNDIKKFENQNLNISVNVYGYEVEEDRLYPLCVTEHRGRKHMIHLLLLSGSNPDSFHYCLINTKSGYNGLSRLLTGLTKSRNATHYCPYCLHRFSSSDQSISRLNLDRHINECKEHGVQRIKMPDPSKEREAVMKFRNYSHTLRAPYTIYADFESFIVPIDTCARGPVAGQGRTKNDMSTKSGYICEADFEIYSAEDLHTIQSSQSFTNAIAQHIPSGYSYVIVDEDGDIVIGPVVYRATKTDDNIVEKMLRELLNHGKILNERLRHTIPMNLSPDEELGFQEATFCFLCHEVLGGDRVRHHSHTNGKYLGACHTNCNLNAKSATYFPTFFHNLKNYDCHHIVQALANFKNEKVSCIANTSERFISISLGPLRFLDSLQFMNSSLETLVQNLKANCTDINKVFKRMASHFNDPEKRDMLIRKGVFPYEYMTGADKFDDTALPPPSAFYSQLSRDGVSESDYLHSQNVWATFNIQTLGEYHDLYLVTDVLLLADVFESFRDVSLEYYQLDPCHFYSTPHLTWNAMLKMTRVQLELLTDLDMHLFIERGTRGGVSMIPNRYARANNPEMEKYSPGLYDSTKPTSWIMYYDCTNLYGTAMIEPLPYGGFRWLSSDEIDSLDWCNVSDDGNKGYVLEVDLLYPKELHTKHSDYSLAPERKVPPPSTLGNGTKKRVQKLLNTLDSKTRYVLHYRNLKYYTSLGLQLTKIHRVIEFSQSAWLQPYILFNTEKRRNSRNSFEKDFFKLMNNAVYGKSLENIRKRIDFNLVLDTRKLDRLIAKPRVKRWFVYNRDVAGVILKKTEITLNRPIYVGFSILDISKLIMYRFHYDYSLKKYGDKVKLLMTDTDSLLYHIETPNIYTDMKEHISLFDTSDYPQDNMCYSTENNKKLGTFKDELNSIPAVEFIGLKAKMYSLIDARNFEKRVAKGVPRSSIKKDLTHELYRECLNEARGIFTSSCSIRSGDHNIYTILQRKLSLSPFDDKRYILPDNYTTLAYGHYKLRQMEKRSHEGLDEDDSPPAAKRAATSSEHGVL